MRTPLPALAVLLCLLAPARALAVHATASPAMAPLSPGQDVPALTITAPLSEPEAAQLGVKPAAAFKLSEIKAQAVILVVFSMYCPFCQRDAPELPKLQEMLRARGLQDTVKLVGLGAGNSPFEVNVFREKFALSFPLLPDPDFAAYKLLGQVGTPYYYVLKRKDEGFVVADGVLGCMASPEAFLKRALGKLGLGGGK